MGLLDGAFDALGLTPDMSGAINAAAFDPYNIQTSYGGANYDAENRLFSTSLNPALQGVMGGLQEQYGQINPEQQLNLMRERAQPYNEAMGQGIENRLFSQGLLGASKEYQPGGQMRGFFDSVMNQDMGFQLSAQQQAQQQQTNLLNQIFGLAGLENNLFGQQQQFGALQTGAGANQASLMAQQAMAVPNLVGNIISGGVQGAAMGGIFGGGGGAGVSTNYNASFPTLPSWTG